MDGAETVARHMRRQARARATRARARAERLRHAAGELAELLACRHGARRVVLFGSLAWGEPDERADIDLAVAGLDPARLMRAQGELLLAAPCAVDLLLLEDAPPELSARIAREGKVLHDERSP